MPRRVAPRCPHFGVCGGCTLQHADAALQLAAKQRALEDALQRIGRVRPETLLPAIAGPAWGYRHRARMSVRDVPKKGGVLVGFHERKSSFVADMRECHVLPPKISALLPKLRTLIESLSIRKRLPQIEVAVGERLTPHRPRSGSMPHVNAMRARGMRIARAACWIRRRSRRGEARRVRRRAWRRVLAAIGRARKPCVPFHPRGATLAYTLPEFDIALPFAPTDFTQVNAAINRVLVRRAVELLDPRPGERVADFFCGLGNFTLPIARRGAHGRRRRGQQGARRARAARMRDRNGLARPHDVRRARTCSRRPPKRSHRSGRLDRALIDPPREGALELVKSLPHATMSDACSASSTYRAARRRSRAMPACWSTSAATGLPRRVWSTCFRTRRTSSRWRSSIDATRSG